jgi:predicted nucleic acid-binding protein
VKKYLLDTNIVSELRKTKPHGSVLAWLRELRDEQIFLSAVTFGELQRGIERTRARDRIKAKEIESWVERLANSTQILAMDAVCFREWARLLEGKQEHLLEDAMIAATARIHGLVVATRNDKDFAQLDVPIENPFRRGA